MVRDHIDGCIPLTQIMPSKMSAYSEPVHCSISFTAFAIRFTTFQPTGRYRYQFVGDVMTGILRTKEIIKRATLGIHRWVKKCNFCFYCF